MEYVNSSNKPNIYSREEVDKVRKSGRVHSVVMDGKKSGRVFLTPNRVEFFTIKTLGKMTSILLKKKEMETMEAQIEQNKIRVPNRVSFSRKKCGAVIRSQIIGPEALIRNMLKMAGLR